MSTCIHCDNEATEGLYCFDCWVKECNALFTRLKDNRRIESDRPKVVAFMADRQVFRLRPVSEPSLN